MSYDRGSRFVQVGKLIELLSQLPLHFEIEVNAVGNLSIFAKAGDWRGYIDIANEEVEVVELPPAKGKE